MPARKPRAGRALPTLGALAILLVAIEAHAALTWTSSGALATSATPPPVHFTQGNGASNDRYVKSFVLSPNQTSFSGTFKPKPGTDATVKDVVRVANDGAASRTVTMRASQVSNAQVETMWWIVRNGTTVVAVFDYKAASPSASFALPASSSYQLDLRVDLADGAGRHNAAFPFGLRVEVG